MSDKSDNNSTTLRRGRRQYAPVHGTLYAGNGTVRSCGKCGEHKPMVEGEWKKHRFFGLICKQCQEKKP